jgi:hypothetical protein
MTQAERDRLVALKKAKKKLITQKQTAEELGITERHVRRLPRELKRRGDQHPLRELIADGAHRAPDVASAGLMVPFLLENIDKYCAVMTTRGASGEWTP